jgi:hypothetical protein
LSLGGGRQFETQLKTTPDGAVQQLRMVCGSHDNDVTWQAVDLQQQRADNPLDFARFMPIASFLSKRVELVEK